MSPTELPDSDAIRDALRRLPRQSASDDFTAAVLERAAEAASHETPRVSWRPLAAAASVILALAAGALVHQHRQQSREEGRRAALELRHEELRRELADLRRAAADPPTLYLGTTSDYDVVLDLGPWLEAGSVRPAVYDGPNR